MKKTIFTIFASCLLVLSSLPLSANESSPKEIKESDVQNAVALRASLGLPYETSHVSTLARIGTIETEQEKLLGIPLTDEEENTLKSKLILDEALETVNQQMEKRPNSNGGVTVEGNTIVVHTVGNSTEALLKQNFENVKIDANILFKPVKYSLSQLNEVHDNIIKMSNELNVVMSYVDIENNKVTVLFENNVEENIKKLNDLSLNEDILSFGEAKITISDQAALGIGATVYEGTVARGCTVGIFGKHGTKTVGVTAGHCGPTNSTTTTVYRGSNNGAVGTWKARTSGNTTADAGRFELNSSTTASTSVLGVPLAQTASGTEHTVGVSLGTVVTREDGIPTTNGTIQSSSVTIAQNGNGFLTLSDLVLTSNTSTNGGDSGSIVYRSVYSSTNKRYEAKIYGLLKGLVEVKINNVTSEYGVYSKISNVKSELGLSSFILDTP